MPALGLKIVTPERIVLETQVDEVMARAVDGGLSILPGHEPLVAPLAIDVLRYRVGQDEDSAAIIGGLMEVQDDQVTILSDAAELDVEIDTARANQAKEKAEAEKTQKIDKLDTQLAELALSRAIARLKAAELAKIRRKGR